MALSLRCKVSLAGLPLVQNSESLLGEQRGKDSKSYPLSLWPSILIIRPSVGTQIGSRSHLSQMYEYCFEDPVSLEIRVPLMIRQFRLLGLSLCCLGIIVLK